MAHNFLKLNDSKTEVLMIGSSHLLQRIAQFDSIVIGDSKIQCVNSARNIGCVIDNKLSMVDQVNAICGSCYVHLLEIGQIRPYLSEKSAATLVHAFISSKLDCLNSVLYGIPEYMIQRLQLIQNHAARIVSCTSKYDSVKPQLLKLHWLPVCLRIEYKILLLTYKCIHQLAPTYLSELIQTYHPGRSLRSSSEGLLKVPNMRLKTAGDRAFTASAPTLWNRLPKHIRECNTVESFKSVLKTHLFQRGIDTGLFQ
jgi:hypothetical protein